MKLTPTFGYVNAQFFRALNATAIDSPQVGSGNSPPVQEVRIALAGVVLIHSRVVQMIADQMMRSLGLIDSQRSAETRVRFMACVPIAARSHRYSTFPTRGVQYYLTQSRSKIGYV